MMPSWSHRSRNPYNLYCSHFGGYLCHKRQLNPPQTWMFSPKTGTTSSHHLGPIEHFSWPPSLKLDVWHVPPVPLVLTDQPNLVSLHMGDIVVVGHERAAEPPSASGDSDMEVSGQKGPHPATVLDPLCTWCAIYHQLQMSNKVPWVSWIHMNHSNLELQPFG